jgi:hypothetical protein
LKVDFLSSLIKAKKLIEKKRPVLLCSSEVKSPEKMIVVEELDPPMIMPSSSMLSLHSSVETIPLSDSNRETERYLERILSSVATKGPFTQISPDIEGIGKTLELEHSG